MSAFPEWMEPMAATLTEERFTGPDWIFERKLDGVRLLAYKRQSDVRLYSRNRLPQNDSYPAVVRAVARLPVDEVILDGEATGVWGPSDGKAAVAYHVFDIMWLDGRDVTSLPLDQRRALLNQLPLH
jgi:bifunctional non-homologous end joining protein LigD